MEIRIGIINAPREITFETNEASADVSSAVTQALDSESKYLRLTDDKGTQYVVPTAGIGYVQIGSEESRRIGFVA